MSLIITSAAVAIAVIACLLALQAHLALRRTRRRTEREARAYQNELDGLRALLAAEPGLALAWLAGDAADSDPVTPIAHVGRLDIEPADRRLTDRLAGRAGPAALYDTLTGLLCEDDRHRLQRKMAALLDFGEAFQDVLSLTDGLALLVRGQPLGRYAVLKIRPAKAEEKAIARLEHDLAAARAALETERGLLERLPVALWRRDQEARLLWVNDAFARLVGAADAASALATGRELVPDAADLAREASEELPARRRVEHAGQAYDLIEMPSAEGSAGLALRIEAPAPESEAVHPGASLGATLDRLPTAAAWFDADGALALSNPAFRDLWRLDDDWLTARPGFGEFLDHLRETRQLPEQADYRAWKREESDRLARAEDHRTLWHLPDGRHIRLSQMAHPEGGTFFLFDDMSETIALQSSLNSVVEVQRTTLDNLHEAVAAFGSDGRLKLCNDAFIRLWRLPAAELGEEPHFNRIMRMCRPLFDDDREWARIGERITAVTPERAPLSDRLERADGAVLDYSAIPLPDGGTLLTFLDVSDTMRIERALRERNLALQTADQLKSEFISNVSYQLRNPLNAIVGFSEMLTKGMAGPLEDRPRAYAGDILTSANQLKHLVNDILDLAMIEAGKLKLEVADVDVSELVENARALVGDLAEETGVALNVRCPKTIGTLTADGRRLGQVLANLLTNALKHTHEGDEIYLSVQRQGRGVRFEVRDTGSGISAEHQASVFDRFETAGTGKAGGERRGAGLGLSLVKSFIELHGGWVTLDSEAGKGTSVTCYVPDQTPGRDAAA